MDTKKLKAARDATTAAYQLEIDASQALAVLLVAAQRAATNDIAAHEAYRAVSADYNASCKRLSVLAEKFERACERYDEAIAADKAFAHAMAKA
jgi:hypothetical protein